MKNKNVERASRICTKCNEEKALCAYYRNGNKCRKCIRLDKVIEKEEAHRIAYGEWGWEQVFFNYEASDNEEPEVKLTVG